MKILRLHLDEIGMTYWQHLRRAAQFSFFSLVASVVLLIHGIIPFVFTQTGSRLVQNINNSMSLNNDL